MEHSPDLRLGQYFLRQLPAVSLLAGTHHVDCDLERDSARTYAKTFETAFYSIIGRVLMPKDIL